VGTWWENQWVRLGEQRWVNSAERQGRKGFLTEKLPLQLLADEYEHCVNRHRPGNKILARVFGRLEGRNVTRWIPRCSRKIKRDLRGRQGRFRRKCRGLIPNFPQMVVRKQAEVPLELLARSEKSVLEVLENSFQGFTCTRVIGVENCQEFFNGLGRGGRAFAGQEERKEGKKRESEKE
jgi:hypothetical protein